MMFGLWVVEEVVGFCCSRPQRPRTQGLDVWTVAGIGRFGFGGYWG